MEAPAHAAQTGTSDAPVVNLRFTNTGEWIPANAQAARVAEAECAKLRAPHLVIDVTNVANVDSQMLSEAILARKAAIAAGGRATFLLTPSQGHIRLVFQVTQLDKLFAIHEVAQPG